MVVPSYYILTSYVLDLKHAYLDILRAYHWIPFYTVINMVFPCEMLIDYHTKKFSHLNTLMRFTIYYKLRYGVYDTSTSMKMQCLTAF